MMYRGGPMVKRYAPKVRHAKRGVRTRTRQILASFVKFCLKVQFFEVGNGWYDGRHQSWGPEPMLGLFSLQHGTL